MLKKTLGKIFFFKHWPKKYLVLILFAIIGLAWFIQSRTPKPIPIQLTKVQRIDIKSTVSSSGVLNGIDSASLKFKGSGKLAYINVKEGDKVTKGQVIATLDTKDLEIALQQARNTWLSKDATAKQVEDHVKDHASDETFTQREERIAAQTARDNAFDAIKAAQRNFEDATLTSPLTGIVTQVGPVAGQVVSSADIIAQIVDQSEILFDTEVDEADISKISLGLPAEVTVTAYGDKIFKGTVSQINEFTKTTSSGATVVIVRIKLDPSNIKFATGLNGQAAIITAENKNVLAIPLEALQQNNTVFVQNGNNYEAIPVKPGLKSDTGVEILEGLSENQKVVTNPQAVKVKK